MQRSSQGAQGLSV